MFKKNDSILLWARILIWVILSILVISSLVIGIILAVKVYWYYIFYTIACWFICFVWWVFARLLLSFFCDVKLIRNKLYNESNENLEVFFNTSKTKNDHSTTQDNKINISLNSEEGEIEQTKIDVIEKIDKKDEQALKNKKRIIRDTLILSGLAIIFILFIILWFTVFSKLI